jgi:hypothetical protein
MPKTLDANQLQKIDRPFIKPIYLVHLSLSGLTLYFSDQNYRYNGHDYEAYLFDLSSIGNEIRNLGGADNSQVTLRFKNEKILAYNTLIELFDAYPPEKKYVEIYKLLIDPGETFASDVSTKIFKGEMGQPYDIYDPPTDFNIDCSLMLFGKNASLPLDVIDLADFANADPDDVGKNRNILYGSLKKVVCPWTVAGWLSTLTADITAAATSIVVSDSNGCPATPFTTFCDNEEIRVTANTKATGTLTVTRGYNSTTAVAHSKGSEIYEKRSDFEAEVAQHPVKAIGDVYIKRGSEEWLRVLSGVTKYINTGGRAYLVFSDKVKYEEKTNLAVGTGSHLHPVTLTLPSLKKCIPTGPSGCEVAFDGNEDTHLHVTYGYADFTFTETNYGTVVKQYVYIFNDSNSMGAVVCGGTTIGSVASGRGLQRFSKTGGGWNDNVEVWAGGGAGAVSEIYKEIEYTPSAVNTDNHAADGVTLSGNSVANMVIGDQVAADVEGYADPDGNYGGAGNLIERPDYVRKHILIILLGFVAGDIGASFATVGTTYAGQISGGYKFAFNLSEVAQETMDLFREMDFQSRSNMFEAGGKFQLAFGSTTDPTSQMTFDKKNVSDRIKFGKTEVADIRNKLRGHYLRDYSKSGNLGDKFQKVLELSNGTSITKYGTIQEDIEFSCVGDLALMVDDVMDWILLEKKELKKTVEFLVFWNAMILEHGDYFTVTSTFWSGLKFKTIKLLERPRDQKIEIKGLQFVSS